jgi:dTDP-4-dehydrorhamnose reductase
MRIAVVGARGQLGAALVRELGSHHEVAAFDRQALDITDPVAVSSALAAVRPAVIVNCAAYNAVDAAEDHPVEALQTNALAVRSLARAARTHDATLVHYSTDFVFDGRATLPYTEEDRPNPRSVYAASKLIGEWFAADAPRGFVLRVESLFGQAPGSPAKGSAAAIVKAIRAGVAPRVFEDRTVSPSYVPDVVMATKALLESGASPGLYHCVNSGCCTWLEFGRETARQLGVEPRFEVVRQVDLEMAAERPQFCVLSNGKLSASGVVMPAWQDALARYLATLRFEP